MAALGSKRFMSPGSKYDGPNLLTSKFAVSQAGRNALQLHWTPIFARGVVRIDICDPDAAARDANMPAKLNDTTELSKFIRNVLPHELKRMQAQYAWPTLPRTVVHDKASYMVNSKAQRRGCTWLRPGHSFGHKNMHSTQQHRQEKAERRLVPAALHWTCLCTETPGIHGAPHWTCLCT